MTVIAQIAPAIRPGSGVEAVAFHLEQEFERAGVRTERFTMKDARGDWIPETGRGWVRQGAHALRVTWFSTVGTVLARRRYARRSDVVTICHNDVVAGDVYINHGILQVAMRARGNYVRRMVRNPLHLFTAARDHIRYRGTVHQTVVNLTEREDVDLRRTYPGIRPRTLVIGNGVDVDRYRPPSDAERTSARQSLSLAHEDLALLFVGHEHERKGLPVVLDALAELPENVRLIVVGGSVTAVDALRRSSHARGLGARVQAVGSCEDPRAYFHAADALVFPSSYESYGLVVLEALASGLPVVATSTGCVPDVILQGVNGYVVDGSAQQIRGRILDLLREGPSSMAHAARRTAEAHSWAAVAREYLAVVDQVVQSRAAQPG